MKKTLILPFLLVHCFVFSQGNTSEWFFGSGFRLDFSQSPYGYSRNNNWLNTPWSSASVEALANGNAILSSNGNILFDEFLDISIPNINLNGNAFSLQNVLIVPNPSNINSYYIFANLHPFANDELSVLEFDLSLNNASGGVVPGSLMVLESRVTSKLFGYFNESDGSYWILTQRENSPDILTYKIDNNGLNTTPVVSPVGNINLTINNRLSRPEDGQGVFSPDGTKVFMLSMVENGLINRYDFDRTTGILSNSQIIDNTLANGDTYSGIALSANGQVLYASAQVTSLFSLSPPNNQSELYQFDLSSGIPASIRASKLQLQNIRFFSGDLSGIQLSPDGKIFVANNTRFVTAVLNPNVLGVGSNYNGRYIDNMLPPGNGYGYPNLIANTIINEIRIDTHCLSTASAFSLSESVDSVIWNFDDLASGANNTSTSTAPSHQFTATGRYRVTANVIQNGIPKQFARYIRIFDPPILNSNIELVNCDDDSDGITDFDLNLLPQLISNNYGGEKFYFFRNQSDAINRTNEILLTQPYTNTNPLQEDLFVVVDNRYGCSEIIQVGLIVDVSPIPSTFELNLSLCNAGVSGNISAVFDLTSIENDINNFYPNNSNLTISFFLTENDATSNSNAITNPTQFEVNVLGVQGIFVRVEENGNSLCTVIDNFLQLNVEGSPSVPMQINLEACDDNYDGIASFDTSNAETQIIGNQNNVTLEYFDSNGSFLTGGLPNPYSSNTTTLTYRLTDNNSNSNPRCFSEGTLALNVFEEPTINNLPAFYACDDGNGIATFDTSNILNQLGTGNNLLFEFFDSNSNSLGPDLGVSFTSTTQTITVEASLISNSNCFASSQIDFVVLDNPEINLDRTYEICQDETLTLSLNPTYDSYFWSNGELTSTATFTQSGNYQVIVENMQNGEICSNSFDFSIVQATTPSINNIITNNQNLSVIVEMSDNEPYLFSVNGVDFQNSNIFEGLELGNYTLTVKDPLDCSSVMIEFNFLGYPKFFTPNNDGYHDNWNVLGTKSDQILLTSIFDRYGKLIKQISSDSLGWDGTYNGQPLPSNDYWFQSFDGDDLVLQGHFTMKR